MTTNPVFIIFCVFACVTVIIMWKMYNRIDELEEQIEIFSKEFSKGVIDYTKNIEKRDKIPSRQQPNIKKQKKEGKLK